MGVTLFVLRTRMMKGEKKKKKKKLSYITWKLAQFNLEVFLKYFHLFVSNLSLRKGSSPCI